MPMAVIRHSRESGNPRTPTVKAAAPSFPRKRESRTFPANAGIFGKGLVDSRFRGNDGGGRNRGRGNVLDSRFRENDGAGAAPPITPAP